MHMNFTGERFVPQLQGQIYYEHLHRYAVSLPLVSGKDVLDIASGEGYGAAFLAMAARSVVGVDIDEGSVHHAAARYPAMNLSFRVGSATHIPLADASIDVITSFETIEHLAEHEQMLGEMQRVLRSDGHLLISSPNRLVYSDERNYSNPFHVRELYFDEFRDLLRTFFPEVHIYGQRIFAACAIHPIDGSRAGTRWLGPSLSRETGIPGLPNPEYFVAVCGRKAGTKLPNLSTVYLDLRDDLLADVRSGGLTATGHGDLMLERGAHSPSEKLAITSVRSNSTADPAPLKEQLSELERALEQQTSTAGDLSIECERLRNQCLELEELRYSDNDRLTKQCQALEDLRCSEDDRLTKLCQDSEALRATESDRADRAERELRVSRRREAEGRLERENLAALPGEVDALTQQLHELERIRAADLTQQLHELERVRTAEFERAESWRLEAQMKDRSFELLLARLSGLRKALEEALLQSEDAGAQLSALKASKSWRVTAPLRQAVNVLLK